MKRRGARVDGGSASIWVLACCALLMLVAVATTLQSLAVLARHRAESAADLAALAAAEQIGVGAGECSAAERVAAANRARVLSCVSTLAADGRTGEITVRISLSVRLAVIGSQDVRASAVAGR